MQVAGDGTRNGPVLKSRSDFHRTAHLAHTNGTLQAAPAEQDPGQVVGDRAESGNAEGFTFEIFEPVDFRLNEEP